VKTGKNFDERAVKGKAAYIWKLFLQDIYHLKYNGLTKWRIRAKELTNKRKSTPLVNSNLRE